jgi:hypothetical protein
MLIRRIVLPLGAALLLAAPPAAVGQEGLRVGLSFGGTGIFGAVAEWRRGDHGAEVVLSTFSFRDVGVSVAVKQYFGASRLKPTIGAGLWFLVGAAPEGRGSALVARFPLGGDWRVGGGHHATFELGVNRGLWVDRPDPSDRTPINSRLIPIPAVSYRFDPD